MDIDVKRVDHWGIVTEVIKDLGIIDLVNEKIGTDNQKILTTGDVVTALAKRPTA